MHSHLFFKHFFGAKKACFVKSGRKESRFKVRKLISALEGFRRSHFKQFQTVEIFSHLFFKPFFGAKTACFVKGVKIESRLKVRKLISGLEGFRRWHFSNFKKLKIFSGLFCIRTLFSNIVLGRKKPVLLKVQKLISGPEGFRRSQFKQFQKVEFFSHLFFEHFLGAKKAGFVKGVKIELRLKVGKLINGLEGICQSHFI